MATTATVPSDPQPVTSTATPENMPLEQLAEQVRTGEPEPAPAPVTTQAPTPEPAKPYTITKNADGTQTVQFMGEKGPKEVFTGTLEQVVEQIANKAASADQRIRELTPTTQPQVQTETAPPTTSEQQFWVPEEAIYTKAVNDMVTTGDFRGAVSIGLAQMFGTQNPSDVPAAIGKLMELHQKLEANEQMAEFTRQAPDFPWAQENVEVFWSEMDRNRLPRTVENMVLMHNALKSMGKYKATPQGTPATPDSPNPLPPTNTGVPVAQAGNEWTMPLDQLAAQIKAGM